MSSKVKNEKKKNTFLPVSKTLLPNSISIRSRQPPPPFGRKLKF